MSRPGPKGEAVYIKLERRPVPDMGEFTGYADGQNVGGERKRRIKDEIPSIYGTFI